MAGLVPAIHVFLGEAPSVDARVEPGHDGEEEGPRRGAPAARRHSAARRAGGVGW
jgi:hypothetical protein